MIFELTLIVSVVLSATAGQTPPPAGTLELRWQVGGKARRLAVPLEGLTQSEVERTDLQYARPLRFRGVPLSALLAKLPGDGTLVLAHFENGMVVPLPDAKGLERLAPFVATRAWSGDAWGELPPASKPGTKDRDVRPTRFAGNKLVLTDRWHPNVPEAAQATFSPWMHVNALVALERVSTEAFAAQFPEGKTANEKKGRAIFEQRCRFCHGARGVGASFGWDFVDPVPLHTYRSPHSLFMHVRYRAGDAPEKGYMMPQLSDLTAADAQALWDWMRLLAPEAPTGQ